LGYHQKAFAGAMLHWETCRQFRHRVTNRRDLRGNVGIVDLHELNQLRLDIGIG
jgi:hypothetical protein